jgi:hypothetical protein
VGFDLTGKLVIRSLHSSDTGKNGSTMREYISYSQTSRKPMIQLGELYNILIESGVHMKLVRLLKMC